MNNNLLLPLPLKAKDGVILHAFNWSFTTIKEKLKEIAEAGYKSIQVSPVQGTKNSSKDPSNWWLLYQPINQQIGNTQLGNLKEFNELCNEAKKYGLIILVDAVLNHMANSGNYDELDSSVDSNFKRTYFYHNEGQCFDWNNRWCITQQGIGMPDLNTKNPEVQKAAIEFLNTCIFNGAGGFRFDGAKHIETNMGLDAGKPWSSNYWNVVLGNLINRENLFMYGEVIQGGADNIEAYTKLMNVTAHSYSFDLRFAVTSKNLKRTFGMCGLNPYNCVSYVENHDNYEHRESNINSSEISLAWSILAARAGVTPLFFVRPTGNLGSYSTNKQWKSSEITAINKFHNAMVGKGEYLRWTRNETMLIERENIGMVIVNAGTDTFINSPTNLKDGAYLDKKNSNCTFKVSNGKITGYIAQKEVAILY